MPKYSQDHELASVFYTLADAATELGWYFSNPSSFVESFDPDETLAKAVSIAKRIRLDEWFSGKPTP